MHATTAFIIYISPIINLLLLRPLFYEKTKNVLQSIIMVAYLVCSKERNSYINGGRHWLYICRYWRRSWRLWWCGYLVAHQAACKFYDHDFHTDLYYDPNPQHEDWYHFQKMPCYGTRNRQIANYYTYSYYPTPDYMLYRSLFLWLSSNGPTIATAVPPAWIAKTEVRH